MRWCSVLLCLHDPDGHDDEAAICSRRRVLKLCSNHILGSQQCITRLVSPHHKFFHCVAGAKEITSDAHTRTHIFEFLNHLPENRTITLNEHPCNNLHIKGRSCYFLNDCEKSAWNMFWFVNETYRRKAYKFIAFVLI